MTQPIDQPNLLAEWTEYLQRRSHVIQADDEPPVLRSRNGNRMRYRWLFLLSNTAGISHLPPPMPYLTESLPDFKTERRF